MAVIDADTHVDECEATWSYMTAAEARYKPVTVVPQEEMAEGAVRPGYSRNWLIDGHLNVRRIRDDVRTGTTREARELHDVQARLDRMDELGVDIHVMYPTVFLHYITANPAIQSALCKSYNRWLADRSAESGGRLRWVAVLPTLDVGAAVEELQWASGSGACGVFKVATEYGRKITDPYFYPLYEAAEALNLPICVHTGGWDSPVGIGGGGGGDGDTQVVGAANVLNAFGAIVISGLAQRFSSLRFGFIEAGASWIPYVLDRLYARRERMAWAFSDIKYGNEKETLFQENRLYVTCQTMEDVAYLLKFGTENHLMIGTDFSHADQSADIDSMGTVKGWGTDGTLTREAAQKILEDNPAAFYRL
jgi:predicted TIM-barrel fold metal-dependent hydrolase